MTYEQNNEWDFFSGSVVRLETGWVEAVVANISDVRASYATGKPVVDVSYEVAAGSDTEVLKRTLPKFMYRDLVKATGQPSMAREAVLGQRVSIFIEVGEDDKIDVKSVQSLSAPRNEGEWAERRQQRAKAPRYAVAAAPPTNGHDDDLPF